MFKNVNPALRSAPAFAGSESDAEMHFRFEINYIVDEITGPPPVVKILKIAWLEKRQYVRRFLLDYHARYRTLPSALHDLGATHKHHLPIGVIDFAQVRQRVYQRTGRRQTGKPFWAKWFDFG